MPRKPREEAEGATHHLWAHGIDDKAIFRDELDRIDYVQRLARATREFGWRCLAFCLMDTHVHLLIETPRANLGLGMQQFHGEYAQTFNKRYARRGHLFEKRFGSKPMRTDEQLKVVARYIALNPVAAGLCACAEDYRWSSHSSLLLGHAPPWLDAGRLLEYFGANGGDPLDRYRRFVTDVSGEAEALGTLDGLGAVADAELAIDGARVLLDGVR